MAPAMLPLLFQPLRLRELTLPNRVVLAPMCQYSADDGHASDWHLLHLGQYAVSGLGLLLIEATAVEPCGRITPDCLGLWSDTQASALERVLQAVRPFASMPIGLQLGHAGRKASSRRPGLGRGYLSPGQGGWQVVGPSSNAFDAQAPVPQALELAQLHAVRDAFVAAARRADRIGIDLLELHAAHGYLLSSFLSPLANQRSDAYGGTLANRMRFPLEVFEAVRDAWPAHKPLGVRFNGTDWVEAGFGPADAVQFARALQRLGCDFVDLSSGGNARAAIPMEPGYQVPLAARVKSETGMPTMAVGLIRAPDHAEQILRSGSADLIAIGRGLLHNPRWVWHAAEHFGLEPRVPHQYMRGATAAGLPSQDTLPRTV